ncbi:hypothetical protein U1Q18_004354 [Sarracenia purpurea var. burkii]
MGYCTTSSVAKLAVQCGDVELEKKIDEKIDQFIDKVEKQPNKKNQETGLCIGFGLAPYVTGIHSSI